MTSGDATRDAIAGELAACATLCAGLERAYARRRALMLAADAAGMSRAESERLSGLSARSGRLSQILGARPSLYSVVPDHVPDGDDLMSIECLRRFRKEDVERMRKEMWSQFAPDTTVTSER